MELHPNLVLYVIKREGTFLALGILLLLAGIVTPFIGAPFEFGAASGALGLLLILFVFGYSHIYCQVTRLYISEEEIVYEAGVLGKISRRIPLHMFTEAAVSRTFFDTLLGAGTLRIYGRLGTNSDMTLSDSKIEDVKAMQQAILDLVRELPPSLPDQYDVPEPGQPSKPAPVVPVKK